jgi:chondroitin sulfate proteoglycan 4
MYVGGIELNRRARALGQGLKSADTSFKGCFRSLLISSHPVGLPHAKVSFCFNK